SAPDGSATEGVLFLGATTVDLDAPASLFRTPVSIPPLPDGTATYVIEGEIVSQETQSRIHALHTSYEARHAVLQAGAVVRREQEAALRANPARPSDIIVRFRLLHEGATE